MPLLEYNITRPVYLSRLVTVLIFAAAVAWILVVTLINVAAVGYELVQVTSTDFNRTSKTWYDHFIPGSGLIPSSWSCTYSVLKLNEGLFSPSSLIEVLLSYPGVVPYSFLGYNDAVTDDLVDGMAYSNTPLSSCEIVMISILQYGSDPVQDNVHLLAILTKTY